MTNGQWELEELEAVLEPEEGTQRSVSCRWKHGGLGPMGELGARSVPGLSGLLRASGATQCNGSNALQNRQALVCNHIYAKSDHGFRFNYDGSPGNIRVLDKIRSLSIATPWKISGLFD